MDDSLYHLRHTLAHLTAASVIELFPGAQNAIGPAIEDGFYQDFELPVPLSSEDLQTIEEKMREKLKSWKQFSIKKVTPMEAREKFAWNKYKTELVNDFEKEGKDITLTTTGDFLDLCKGGHLDDLTKINPEGFRLTKVAGAYWKGDERNPMLTRIYGVAFFTKEELDQHLSMLSEAEKRDHRKLGKELDLFVFSDLVGAGLALWTPRGTILRNVLDDYIWELRRARGYQKVTIPHITKKDLYEMSGHWEKFHDDLFKIVTREHHEFAMKPMNCPHHTQIYSRKPHSYRDLPQRYAETTMVYRDEQSGELVGLSRVRCITQDDAHVFCRESQIKQEMYAIWDIINEFYRAVGFGELEVRLSFHDPAHMEKYLGSPEVWKKTENELRELVKERGATAVEAIGEAAMYGPKIDFITKDALGRKWQVATIQIDRNQPERFDLSCINEEGGKERIVMLHAAIMGSIERFLSVLIEHLSGAFPLWLAPTQITLLPVSEKYLSYAREIYKKLTEKGLRVEIDESNESVGKKVRNAAKSKVPYAIVLGEQEVIGNVFALRVRGKKEIVTQDADSWIAAVLKLERERSLSLE